jgi:very-short-patch-repair endonuclease
MPKRLVHEPYLSYSRQLRKSQTPWEAKLWSRLRAHRFLGLQFKRQVQIGAVIVDFSCRAKKLAIELDGSQHNEASGKFTDNQKQEFLESQGYIVLHFWNNEIDKNLEGVLEVIKQVVTNPSPTLPSFSYAKASANSQKGEGVKEKL